MRSRRPRRNRPNASKPQGDSPSAPPPRPSAASQPSRDGGGGNRKRPRRRRGGRGRVESNAPLSIEQIRQRFEKQLREYPPAFEKIEEFLVLCRTLQDAIEKGEIEGPSEEEFFYYIASCIETLAEDRIDRVFNERYRDDLAAIRKEAGLEDNQFWKPGDPAVPERYAEILSEFRKDKREILAKVFEEQGEEEVAAMVASDYDRYLQLRSEGRDLFRRRDPLDPLVQRIIASDRGVPFPVDVEDLVEEDERQQGEPLEEEDLIDEIESDEDPESDDDGDPDDEDGDAEDEVDEGEDEDEKEDLR